jgi:Iodothyronine deiodinase
VKSNERDGVLYKEPSTFEERETVAGECAKGMKLTIPVLIDDMKNTAQRAYAGWPDRFYVIGYDGKVAYRGAEGPMGFKPAEAEEALKKSLEE